MRDIGSIIDKIKVKMAVKSGSENVLDKEVAKEIKITSNRLAIHKKRGTVPYVKIMDWCKNNNISIREIFYGAK
jgi:hypothetical protein